MSFRTLHAFQAWFPRLHSQRIRTQPNRTPPVKYHPWDGTTQPISAPCWQSQGTTPCLIGHWNTRSRQHLPGEQDPSFAGCPSKPPVGGPLSSAKDPKSRSSKAASWNCRSALPSHWQPDSLLSPLSAKAAVSASRKKQSSAENVNGCFFLQILAYTDPRAHPPRSNEWWSIQDTTNLKVATGTPYTETTDRPLTQAVRASIWIQ